MSRETKVLLVIVAAVVVLMVGIFSLASKSNEPKSSSQSAPQLTRDASHKTGSGRVTVVEFGDFQCPVCARVHPDTKRIIAEYQGKVTFVFREFPLPQHNNAKPAAEAAEAAGAQGKFWEMHDMLYENQDKWSELTDPTDIFVEYAKSLKLDSEKIRTAIKDNQYASIIDQDTSDGTSAHIQGTPTFFVNGNQVNGIDYQALKSAIDEALGQ